MVKRMKRSVREPSPPWLEVCTEVQEALDAGQPIVALESTLISHGLPYPQNLETAQMLESTVREGGATPATIAILDGAASPHDYFQLTIAVNITQRRG